MAASAAIPSPPAHCRSPCIFSSRRDCGSFPLMRGGWVYILASRRNGTLYTGVTADLAARLWQHRTDPCGFVARYHAQRLVHAEAFPTIDEAIAREKAIKKWRRAWKIELIERDNPGWDDLFEHVLGA